MTDHDSGTPAPNPVHPLTPWGWERRPRSRETESAARGLSPARVTAHRHHFYDLVRADDGEVVSITAAQVSGAFAYRSAGPEDYPTVGDWVLVEPASGTIHAVLSRRTAISRKAAGAETLEQVIVANLDVVLLVFALDGERGFTVGLVERAATTAWNSGARPVIVLNKVDLADPAVRDRAVADAEAAAPGVDVIPASARTGTGIDALLDRCGSDETVAMLGKSGVGKSALLNAIGRRRGTEMTIREGRVRRGDLQGRHTTTEKQLYLLPGGPLIADVPGLRELQLWAEDEGLDDTFPEIEALSRECRFRNCRHDGEPGCRVREALRTGELSADRWERYRALQREIAYLTRRRDQRARQEEQMKWKQIAAFQRRFKKGTRHSR